MNHPAGWQSLDLELFDRNLKRLKGTGKDLFNLTARRVGAPLVKQVNHLIWKANRPIADLNHRLLKVLHVWKDQFRKAEAIAKHDQESLERMEGEGPLPSGQ